MGIDAPDVRGVVHAGMPRDLSDYVQQSGRAGRDGEASEAIVLLPAESAKRRYGIRSREVRHAQPVVYRHKNEVGDPEAEAVAKEVEEYIRGKCRRVVIDRVMDENFERVRCVTGEEPCDLCQHGRGADGEEDPFQEVPGSPSPSPRPIVQSQGDAFSTQKPGISPTVEAIFSQPPAKMHLDLDFCLTKF